MTDNTILKLLRSSSVDDVKIGLNFLLEKYPRNTEICRFFKRYGKDYDDDPELETQWSILETNLKKWTLFESERNLMFAVERRMWMYKANVEGAWNYHRSHFNIYVL